MRRGKPLIFTLLALTVIGFSFADDDEHMHRYKRPKRLEVPADALADLEGRMRQLPHRQHWSLAMSVNSKALLL